MKISANYELPISKQNEPVIGIVAKELGYDGVLGTPQEYIENTLQISLTISVTKSNQDSLNIMEKQVKLQILLSSVCMMQR